MRKIKNRKGQMSISEGPTVVLMVGIMFLMMATVALVGEKYGDAMGTRESGTVIDEEVTVAERVASTRIDAATECNFGGLSIVTVVNASDQVLITAPNYTISGQGVTNVSGEYELDPWDINYTYTHAGIACNVTSSLNTEIAANTDIAGVVLTISLVGIVLTILIGIFVGFRQRKI